MRQFAETGYLYAILDSCDAPAVPEKAKKLGESSCVSLFKGTAEEDYWAVAPYLFRLAPQTLDWIQATLWKDPWGIFAISKSDLGTIHSHLRRFLMAQLPDGKRWYFRYYDPRVMPVYLSAAAAEEAQGLFGPVRAFAVHDLGSDSLSMLTHAAGAASNPAQAGTLWSVSPAAVEALSRSRYQDFERRMVEHLQKTYGADDHDTSHETLRRFVEVGVASAGKYGIELEAHIARYLELMVVWGHNFDSDPKLPWAGTLLRDASMSAEEKLDGLTERTQFGPW